MSETLSTLIAFVGFLILLSMLVQALQEGLKNLFKLKTGVYERFFINLYKEEFFKRPEEPAEKEQVKHSSFWKIFRSEKFIGEFDKRMGRLKKVVDQAGEIFRETKDALRRISELDPSSPDYTQKIAASVQPVTNSLAKVTALRLDLVLDIYDKFDEGKISRFYEAVLDFNKKYALPLEDIAKEELQKCPERAKQLLMVLDKVKGTISNYRLQIEERMDAWLAQLNEVYRRNMLKWTVALGAVIVIFFNADAFNIYQYLSKHEAARAVISQTVEGVVVPAQKTKAEDLNKIDTLIQKNNLKEAKGQIQTLSTNLEGDFTAYKDEAKAKDARTIKDEVAKIPPDEKNVASLKTKTGEITKLYFDLQKISVARRVEMLTDLDLPLGWSEDWEESGLMAFLRWKKIGGLILTIFLITFGAPFWNDILSALTGIKNKAVKEGKPGEKE